MLKCAIRIGNAIDDNHCVEIEMLQSSDLENMFSVSKKRRNGIQNVWL